ncbi:MAG: zinc-binding alcohol dehydrogenase family protein [Pseudohongiella sp.]|nr:zinc-binding alcohol dehydrogenase family protein [Pseudohongiella sp.]MDO9519465.1 zinc-binding alcohol dehydrogenase family protein [Pseudohongiella sp.]MDP2127527.1 zinc-binding alcohol dehydrogenase family protein [Pseudohongiella sp.]
MKAIGYTANGPLYQFETTNPSPGPQDLLVRVSAIAVNPVDTKIRGRVQPPADQPKILGWDAVGIVEAIGSGVSRFKAGDRIWYAGDVTRSGCNAQFQCVDERIAALAPASLSDAEAAAMPLTAITAWEMLFDRLQVPIGDAASDRVVLVVGAAGGVGSVLVQLARQLTSATVIGTASRDDSRAWVKSMGAHHVLDHTKSLQEELKAAGIADVTDVAGINRTGQHYPDLVAMLRPQGRLALIDDPAEPLDIKLMKQKCLSLHWEFMFTRAMFQTADMDEQHKLLSELARLVDKGVIKTTVGQHLGRITPENLEKAHELLKSEHTLGKLVLEGFL